MRKQITYLEPIPQFDPKTHKPIESKMEAFTIITENEEEYEANMKIIKNPKRGITGITVKDLPPIFTEQEKVKADIDYIAIMTGVDLNV